MSSTNYGCKTVGVSGVAGRGCGSKEGDGDAQAIGAPSALAGPGSNRPTLATCEAHKA
jgi:hypothetical protein